MNLLRRCPLFVARPLCPHHTLSSQTTVPKVLGAILGGRYMEHLHVPANLNGVEPAVPSLNSLYTLYKHRFTGTSTNHIYICCLDLRL